MSSLFTNHLCMRHCAKYFTHSFSLAVVLLSSLCRRKNQIRRISFSKDTELVSGKARVKSGFRIYALICYDILKNQTKQHIK